MKVIKKLSTCELELTYSDLNQGCRVYIEAKKPDNLFFHLGDNLIVLKRELEKVCDDWVDELGKSVHTHSTLPLWSFTTEEIYLTREYSF